MRPSEVPAAGPPADIAVPVAVEQPAASRATASEGAGATRASTIGPPADVSLATRPRAAPRSGGWLPTVRLLRPRQWIKNGFVLAPLLFSGMFVHPAAVVRAALATLLFCVASSAAYVLNDLVDRRADAAHPTKSRTRPLATGEVTPARARALLVVLYAVAAASALWSPWTAAVAAIYVALNVAYTLRLKHVPVVDIFTLAAGFVLRVFGGAVAIDVPLSQWMLITTLCLALYLAAAKRRDELTASGHASRAVLRHYTAHLLDRYAEMAALSAVVFYGLFVVTVRPGLAVTVPLVLFGLFRYWYIAESGGTSESPTDAVWGDVPLIVTVIAWAALCAAVLLRHRPL